MLTFKNKKKEPGLFILLRLSGAVEESRIRVLFGVGAGIGP